MKLSFMLTALSRRVALILIVAMAVAGGVIWFASTMPKTYTSSAQILLGVRGEATNIDAQSGNLYLKERVATYAQTVKADEIMEPVAQAAGTTLDKLRRQVSVTIIPETVVLEISVAGRSPEEAVILTNAVSAQFRSEVSSLNVATGGPELVAAQFSSPQPAVDPDQLHGTLLYLVAGLVGLLVGILVALVVATVEVARKRSETKIPATEEMPSSALVTDAAPFASRGTPVGAVGAEPAPTVSRAESSQRPRSLTDDAAVTAPDSDSPTTVEEKSVSAPDQPSESAAVEASEATYEHEAEFAPEHVVGSVRDQPLTVTGDNVRFGQRASSSVVGHGVAPVLNGTPAAGNSAAPNPRRGFLDSEMVRDAKTSTQPPDIRGAKTVHTFNPHSRIDDAKRSQ